MFSNIKRKLNFFVLITVGFIIIFTILTLYGSFYRLITDSYTNKIVRFSKQEVQNSNLTFSMIEKHIDSVIYDSGLSSAILSNSQNSYLIGNIKTYMSYYPYFDSFVIYTNNTPTYYDGELISKLTEYNFSFDDLKFTDDTCWTVIGNDKSKRFVYIKRIANTDNNTSYAVFNIDESYIKSDYSSDNNFTKHKCVYLMSSNNKYRKLIQNPNSEYSFDKILKKYNGSDNTYFINNLLICTERIGNTDIRVFTVNKISYTFKYTLFIIVEFISMFIIMLLLCFIVVNRLGGEISNQLDKIHNEMKNYTK